MQAGRGSERNQTSVSSLAAVKVFEKNVVANNRPSRLLTHQEAGCEPTGLDMVTAVGFHLDASHRAELSWEHETPWARSLLIAIGALGACLMS